MFIKQALAQTNVNLNPQGQFGQLGNLSIGGIVSGLINLV